MRTHAMLGALAALSFLSTPLLAKDSAPNAGPDDRMEQLTRKVEALEKKVRVLEERLRLYEQRPIAKIIPAPPLPSQAPYYFVPKPGKPPKPIPFAPKSGRLPVPQGKIWKRGEFNGWEYYVVPLSTPAAPMPVESEDSSDETKPGPTVHPVRR